MRFSKAVRSAGFSSNKAADASAGRIGNNFAASCNFAVSLVNSPPVSKNPKQKLTIIFEDMENEFV